MPINGPSSGGPRVLTQAERLEIQRQGERFNMATGVVPLDIGAWGPFDDRYGGAGMGPGMPAVHPLSPNPLPPSRPRPTYTASNFLTYPIKEFVNLDRTLIPVLELPTISGTHTVPELEALIHAGGLPTPRFETTNVVGVSGYPTRGQATFPFAIELKDGSLYQVGDLLIDRQLVRSGGLLREPGSSALLQQVPLPVLTETQQRKQVRDRRFALARGAVDQKVSSGVSEAERVRLTEMLAQIEDPRIWESADYNAATSSFTMRFGRQQEVHNRDQARAYWLSLP